jgi:hypothetical protein
MFRSAPKRIVEDGIVGAIRVLDRRNEDVKISTRFNVTLQPETATRAPTS